MPSYQNIVNLFPSLDKTILPLANTFQCAIRRDLGIDTLYYVLNGAILTRSFPMAETGAIQNSPLSSRT